MTLTEQQKDLVRGLEHVRDEYGMDRLYEQGIYMLRDNQRKDRAINQLLNENERLRHVATLAASPLPRVAA